MFKVELEKSLKRATTLPSLIEISATNAMRSDTDSEEYINLSKRVFNQGISDEVTNVIVIEADSTKKSQILSTIFELLKRDFEKINSLEALVKFTLYIGSLGLNGAIGDKFSDEVSENVVEIIGEVKVKFDDWFVEWIAEKPQDILLDKVEESIAQQGNSANEKWKLANSLHLSVAARRKVTELAKKLGDEHTAHEAIQYSLSFLRALAIDSPKLIVVKNPESLDSTSLSLCALMFSHAQEQSNLSKLGHVSFLFYYAPEQNQARQSISTDESRLALKKLKYFTNRYGFLDIVGTIIPRPVISSSYFIGRYSELETLFDAYLACKRDTVTKGKQKTFWNLVLGEPGTGKTALVRKHLQAVYEIENKENRSQILLKISNYSGQSENESGLASLLDSIKSETIRLTELYQSNNNFLARLIKDKILSSKNAKYDLDTAWKNKKVSTQKINSAVKFIASLSGLRTLYESGESAIDSLFTERHFKQTYQSINKQEVEKDKFDQFSKIIEALDKLENILFEIYSDNSQSPIILFIDDLQWIDELTSEFILDYLIDSRYIHVIATARRADSHARKKQNNIQTARLFAHVGLFSNYFESVDFDKPIPLEVDSKKELVNTLIIEGANKKFIEELVRKVFNESDRFYSNAISSLILQHLALDCVTEDTFVTTLFAIETLNLISDPMFYTRNENIPPLITFCDGAYSINKYSRQEFRAIAEKIIDKLGCTYDDSFSFDLLPPELRSGFNLASTAVLEERLFIITEYLGDRANFVCFGLKLAAVIGERFDSEFVNYTLLKLANLDTAEYPELSFLTTYLKQSLNGEFDVVILELLEEIFEIIKRLSDLEGYVFKHSLLRNFYITKYVGVLTELKIIDGFGKDENYTATAGHDTSDMIINQNLYSIDYPIESLTVIFLSACHQYFNANKKKSVDYQRQRIINYYLELVKKIHYVGWDEKFFDRFNIKINEYGKEGAADNRQLNEINKMNKKVIYLLHNIYLNNPKRWAGRYASALYNIAMALRHSDTGEAIISFEKAYDIVKLNYKHSPQRWQDGLRLVIDRLSLIYRHPSLFTDQKNEIRQYREKAMMLETELEEILLSPHWKLNRSSYNKHQKEVGLKLNSVSFMTTSLNSSDAVQVELEMVIEEKFEKIAETNLINLLDVKRLLADLLELIPLYFHKNLIIEIDNQLIRFAKIHNAINNEIRYPASLKKMYQEKITFLFNYLEKIGLSRTVSTLNKKMTDCEFLFED